MRRKYLVGLTLLLVTVVLIGLVFAQGKKESSTEEVGSSVLYVCNCKEDCKCTTVLTKAGRCACGNELVPMHLLKIEKEEALLCRCGKDCTCKLDPDDPTKCTCGKPVKKVNIKGMYVCNCGPDCKCNTVYDKPGKCRCGADLKRI